MEELLKVKSKAHNWLSVELKELWVRAYFDITCKCEHITNNWSGSFNKMLLDLRDLPLVKLVDKYTILMRFLLYKRRCSSLEMDGNSLVPRVEENIANMKKEYNMFTT